MGCVSSGRGYGECWARKQNGSSTLDPADPATSTRRSSSGGRSSQKEGAQEEALNNSVSLR